MALVTDSNKAKSKEIASGIIMPKLVNKWKITGATCLSEDELDLLTLQVIRLKYQFNASEFEPHVIQLVIEDAIRPSIPDIVRKLMLLKDYDLTIAQLDGDINVLSLTVFKGCQGVTFSNEFDYAKSAACQFDIVLDCVDIEFH